MHKMFVKAFILLMGLSTAYTLKCYLCLNERSCTQTLDCDQAGGLVSLISPPYRCFTGEHEGVVAKGCINHKYCTGAMSCCDRDLCNGSVPTGPTVVLLLLSSAIFTLFL